MDNMLPCPFCNGHAWIQPRHDYWRIRCSDCPAEMVHDRPEQVIAAWNRRFSGYYASGAAQQTESRR